MSGTADPWEPANMPTFGFHTQRTPRVEHVDGPSRIYDHEAADPDWKPRPVGFANWLGNRGHHAPITYPPRPDNEPLLWEGDYA